MYRAMMAVVETAGISRMVRVMRMVRMVGMMWIIWIIRIRCIIRIIPGISPVRIRIGPIIWGVAVIWIPVRIPSVVIIWPSESEAGA